MSNRLRTGVIITVLVVWAINLTAPILVRDYEPNEGVNVAFMAIIGILSASYKRDGD